MSYGPFLPRYLCFTGDRAMRIRAVKWNHYDKNYENCMSVMMRNTALYYDSGDKKWLLAPETDGVPKLFSSLPKDPKPIPRMDDTTDVSCWFVASYPIQYMLPFVAAAADAGIDLPAPAK